MTRPKRKLEVSTFRVVNRYRETGVVHHWEANGLTFAWTDWVLCEISWQRGNPPHFCIASSFRDYRGLNEKEPRVRCSVWNPSYDNSTDFLEISKLAHFCPVQVILDSERKERELDGSGIEWL